MEEDVSRCQDLKLKPRRDDLERSQMMNFNAFQPRRETHRLTSYGTKLK